MLTEHCVILSILVVAATAFECYTGRVITGYSGTNGYYDDSDCPKGTQFCLKLITPNKDGGEIIEKSCDINGACLVSITRTTFHLIKIILRKHTNIL
ncbi:unnamed protein product [Toxocara canis]|uniref:Secreted protein n=1 Tax=Toxocara canis TaxID=6265 RepID=A0A183U308_TOXCA|nr:unnamed protein product [Toxocara canis]